MEQSRMEKDEIKRMSEEMEELLEAFSGPDDAEREMAAGRVEADQAGKMAEADRAGKAAEADRAG